jgi:hypothetical protein
MRWSAKISEGQRKRGLGGARIRSFATNILRFNHTQNVANTRYRIVIGGDSRVAINQVHVEEALNSPDPSQRGRPLGANHERPLTTKAEGDCFNG